MQAQQINPILFSILKDTTQRQYIKEKGNQDKKAHRIAISVADMMNVSYFDLQSASRKHPIVMARQIAIFAIRKNTDLSLKEIGNMFGNRDHATVLYSMDTVNDRKDTDKYYRSILNRILNAI